MKYGGGSLTWRVNAEAMKRSAEIDQTRKVQAQSRNGCASCRRNADNLCRIAVPCKMLCPLLHSWMKQRNFSFRHRVYSGLKRAFETVASQT